MIRTLGPGGLVFVLIVSVYSVLAGVQGLLECNAYRTPQTMTLVQFESQPRAEGWYHITGGVVELEGAFVFHPITCPVNTLYAPLRGPYESTNSRVHLMVVPENPQFMDTFEYMRSIDDRSDKDRWAYFQSHRSSIFVPQDVIGRVPHGVDRQAIEHDTIAQVMPNMDPNFVILDEGCVPSLWQSLVRLLGGLAGLVLLVRSFASSRAAKAALQPVNLLDDIPVPPKPAGGHNANPDAPWWEQGS